MPKNLIGYHAIEEMLKRGVGGTLLVSRWNSRIEALGGLAESSGIAVSRVEESELTRICGSSAHRGAVLLVEKAPAAAALDIKGWIAGFASETALVLALDHITDPQNLGAILRTADQLCVDLVLLPSRRSAAETETVAKVSSGASAYVSLLVIPNLVSAMELLKKNGFWVFGADMSGEHANKADLSGRACLVLGGEGEGLHRLVREKCDSLIRIPAAGHVDSFNVSVAAGILMYEARRQQGFPF
jgi:23S rRNA (guanosine2251-2'-O)-methyltransferase